MPERIQKILAKAGIASRRASEELIRQGRVAVNGIVMTELGTRVDPESDAISVDGRPVSLPEQTTVFMVYKPLGVVSTCRDPQGRPTVLELVPSCPGLHPIGRLDLDSEGLLLLTNDGDLTLHLSHPRHSVGKTYRAWVEGAPEESVLSLLRDGVELQDGCTGAAQVECLRREAGESLLEITLHEGRNRQIRRMCGAVGHPVIRLKRIRIGDLGLGELRSGEYRRLTAAEIESLRGAGGI